MKKMLILSLGMLLVLSSCGTYEGAGAYTGAQFGSIVGSAIGGITGGWPVAPPWGQPSARLPTMQILIAMPVAMKAVATGITVGSMTTAS